MKGIILAGGTGSRLSPLTNVTNKHLLPVGKYPMILYLVAKIKQAGIDDIMIISGKDHMGSVVNLLGSGYAYGVNFTFRIQDHPGGIAQALGLCERFVNKDTCVVMLGDNIFQNDIDQYVANFDKQDKGAKILIKQVDDPTRYGVAKLKDNKIVEIEEKPKKTKSNYCVTGIYMYDHSVFDIIKTLKPSSRDELEITDVNNWYIRNGSLTYDILDGWWTDAGTFHSLLHANILAKDIDLDYILSRDYKKVGEISMKVLVTGGNGQLGSTIKKIFKEKECSLGKIDTAYFHSEVVNEGKDTLDITSLENIKNYFMQFKPHIIINTAAYTNVANCESSIDLAFQVNALGARNLAIACTEIKAKLIHISTDYVFDGKNKFPYREFDLPNPINIYGKSKYLGEEYVKQFCSRYFIVRTSWLYGYRGENFIKTILKASKEKECLDVVNDQIGNPTHAEDLAYHILKLALTDEYGIYHCTGNGECSWYEFAREIIDYAHINCKIHPISSYAYNHTAQRPAYSSLDNMMLRNTIGDKMRHWQDALKDFINNLT